MAAASGWARLRRPSFESLVTLALVAGASLFVLAQLHPRLLLTNTTANGGDMGAHVWGPAYLRDHLLPAGRLAGWAPDWYAGFPAYYFYMVVPALLVVAVDALPGMPYNVAFKLVTVSGLVGLPVAAWGLGRLARAPFPVPAALAVGTLPFIFDRSFSIYGGNALSNLAGEFSFTISLCFALLFLGLAIGGFDTRRRRVAAAVVLALCVTCHPIPATFALAGGAASVITTWWRTRRRGPDVVVVAPSPGEAEPEERPEPLARPYLRHLGWLVGVIVVGGLLTSFWTVPFVLRRAYLNDMGWERLTTFLEPLFPGRIGRSLSELWGGEADAAVQGDSTWVVTLAAVGAGASLALRRHLGTCLVVLAVLAAVAFRFAPEGRLWNARLLPFWHLALALLAALAVVELLRAVATLVRPEAPDRRLVAGGLVLTAVLVVAAIALPLRSLPFDSVSADGRYRWLWISTTDQSPVRQWAQWNYSGYEGKDAWPEHRDLIETMAAVGDERGCGRTMWEYEADLNRFGTTMALMLLPYWTDGCIGSMEGLYFESSATTPYHFLNQAELSAAPSRAQRGLPYGVLDVARGVEHLQMLGVRYYLAFSPAAVSAAADLPELTEVARSGEFYVFEVADTALVAPLDHEPVVVDPSPVGAGAWQDTAVAWYLARSLHPVMVAADGPDHWARVAPDLSEGLPFVPLPDVVVSDIESGESSISFTVSEPGVPVVVRTSYFPTWDAIGAEGPYRVAPNLMVVVPTSTEVRLVERRDAIDWLGLAMTGAGALALAPLAGVGISVLRHRRDRRGRASAAEAVAGPGVDGG